MTPPAEIVCFAKVRLKDGREVKAMVTPGEREPVSRFVLAQMVLAASLLMEEAEPKLNGRLRRRSELLRQRMQDAMERER